MSLNKKLFAVPIALISALVLPAFASANTTVTRNFTSGQYRIDATSQSSSQVTITDIDLIDNPGSSNDGIRLTGDGLYGGSGCNDNSAHTIVECTTASTSISGVQVTLGSAADNLVLADVHFPRPLNVLAGYSGNATIVGGSADDTLNGGSGNDAIYGSDGNDTIYGNDGNDHIVGEGGHDTGYGGAGDDVVGMENYGDSDTLDCGPGANDIMGIDLNDSGNSLETSVANCERHVPHTTGTTGTLSVTPVAGATYSAADLAIDRYSLTPAAAPDAQRYRWYICDSTAPLMTNSTLAPANFDTAAGPTVRSGCSLVPGNTAATASITVPNDTTKYLAAVGQSGFVTTAGDIGIPRGPGQFFATQSYASTTPRRIVAATTDPGPAPPTTPATPATPVVVTGASVTAFTASSKVTCKKGKCTIKVTQSAAGKVKIKGSNVKTLTKTVKAGTTTITVKLTSKGKKSLKKKGKLSVKVKVTSTSDSGGAKTANVKLTYKK